MALIRRKVLRKKLLDWFEVEGRHEIPWKLTADGNVPSSNEVLDIYRIWIAEIMLQQTQVKVVIPYWQRWIQSFPNLLDLSNASEQDVLIIWQGLGYYSRARRLKQTSKILLEIIGEKDSLNTIFWPKSLEIWMNLPGIGRTTASSILSSAFNYPLPILDGNIRRIFSRLIALKSPPEKAMHKLWKLSEELLDRNAPRNFNQALMDLGSLICKPRNPLCAKCPWQSHCIAYLSKTQIEFPVKLSTRVLPHHVIGIGIVLNEQGEILIDQRLDNGLLGGLWEFPGGKQEENESIQNTIRRELKEELGIDVVVKELLIAFDHSYSHKKLHFIVHTCSLKSGIPKPLASQEVKWIKSDEFPKYPFPAANLKMIDALLKYLK